MRIYLVRHGETDLNAERRVQGSTDAPLNERGREQARQLAGAFQRREVETVWCSPLVRARETAEIVFGSRSLPIHLEPRLQEMNYGELEALSFAETGARFGAQIAAWRADPGNVAFPGGESFGQLQRRAWAAFEEIRETTGDAPAAVVAHNFTIISLVLRFLDAPLTSFKRFRLRPTGVTIIEDGFEGPALSTLNDVSHLSGADA